MCDTVASEDEGPPTDRLLDGDSLTVSERYEILADEDRRYALYCLEKYGETLALADLADEVARLKHDRPLPEIDPEVVKRVYLRLYHSHVPKLTDAGIVEYDQERDLVRLCRQLSDVEDADLF